MTAPFDAILFDAGGVLVTPDPVQTAIALAPFGASTDQWRHVRAHWAGIAALEGHLLDSGDVATLDVPDWTLYRRAFCATVGVADDQLDRGVVALSAIFSSYLWTHPIAESVSALARLQRSGVPIGVVSNASGQIEHTLRYRGVCQVGPGMGVPVVCVVDSHVVGVAKPDPRIFDGAVEAIGVAPERIAYVGDSVINDIGGARNAGLQPILMDPHDDRAHLDGIARIASLHDLVTMLG